MTEPNENKSDTPSENNIFRITDELVNQVDKSKKMMIILIITLIIALPVLWHAVPVITKSSPGTSVIAGYGTVVIAVIFVALGVRQWSLLSKWTTRYKLYKELQKRVDDKLDFEKDN